MKSKTYRNGKTTCRAYCKDVGNGCEVGFVYGTKTVFVGNFIHTWEANQWYSQMNTEIRTFNKRFTVGKNCPKTWYTAFMANHLYKKYYTFLNTVLTKHKGTYTKAVTQGVKKYKRMNRNWYTGEKSTFLKAA